MSAIANQSSGYTAVNLRATGDAIAGRIVSYEDYQVTEYADDTQRGVKKGDPKFFPKSGDPIMGTRIVLETEPGNEESRVTLWAEKPNMLKAIAAAMRAHGKPDIEVGADLAVTRTGMEGRAIAFSAAYSPPEA